MQAQPSVTECYIFSAFAENAHALEAGLSENAYLELAASVEQVTLHLGFLRTLHYSCQDMRIRIKSRSLL